MFRKADDSFTALLALENHNKSMAFILKMEIMGSGNLCL